MAEEAGCSGVEGVKWTNDMTVFLINLIKENFERLQTNIKKTVYQKIAERIKEEFNIKITFEQVDSKWKGLKRQYKKIKEENDTTGNMRKYWVHFDLMHDILFRVPEIHPPAVICSEDSDVQVAEHFVIEDPETSRTNYSNRKRKNNKVEDMIEKRHRERMEVSNRFLDLFEKMIDKM
ncbi:uncharacterized protein LOC129951514 [Eupeodes corollae]|uniref:uncharacterized protein LOC129951514 n=1 Tax=Eupeodes corollae TaxID=290404 RepID=UPI0024928BB3|nr:uncharacterized protein LOC129951514 [Eupeodes corollae]